jgi:hypothetical protein
MKARKRTGDEVVGRMYGGRDERHMFKVMFAPNFGNGTGKLPRTFPMRRPCTCRWEEEDSRPPVPLHVKHVGYRQYML